MGALVGRFSFIGVRPFQQVRLRGQSLQIVKPNTSPTTIESDQPHRALEAEIKRWKCPFVAHLPPLQGGLVGYVSYDAIRYWEPISLPEKPSGFDDALLSFFDMVVAFDHLQHVIHCIAHIRPEQESLAKGLQRVSTNFSEVLTALDKTVPIAPLSQVSAPSKYQGVSFGDSHAMLGQDTFHHHVKRLKRHIKNGDIFQCVLSDRFRVEVPKDPFLVYRMLRMINPSPYLYYLEQVIR